MAFSDFFKKMVNIPADEDYEEEYEEENFFETEEDDEPRQKSTSKKSDFGGLFSRVASNKRDEDDSQIKVVLVRPRVFEDDTPAIAEHLCAHKTVVLNLELADRENSRRIIDFLMGTAYAVRGNIKQVANSTYIITPDNVDVLGELLGGDFSDNF
jgi:cell division inhibitor SepF